MKLVKTLILAAAAALIVTGVAYADTPERQRDRQRLHDGSCTPAAAAKSRTRAGDAAGEQRGVKARQGGASQNGQTQDGTEARDRTRLRDGSCTTVAAAHTRSRAHKDGHASKGTHKHDRKRLHDGSCAAAA